MPADFNNCVKKKGSHVVTVKPKPTAVIRVCYDSRGKSHRGEVNHIKPRK